MPGWVGCVPMGDMAALACVERREGKRPVVRWVEQVPWTDAAASLRKLKKRHDLHRHRCVAVLPRTHYQVLPMDAPDVPREEWAQAIRWRLKDSVDFPVDQAAVQVLELPQGASHRTQPQVLAVAAPLPPLAELVRLGAEADTPWTAIDIAETALRNICAVVAAPGQVLALLHVGHDDSTLVIAAHGELLMSRHIAFDLAQLASIDAAQRAAAFDRAGLELQRSFDGFERQFSNLSLARLLVAPADASDALAAHLRELLYVPVAPLDLSAALSLRETPELADPQLLAVCLGAIGAALRDE
ncbi:MAG: agglutinin biogenesis protein MshI [Burkholderiaceae bacterium]